MLPHVYICLADDTIAGEYLREGDFEQRLQVSQTHPAVT
jgi:hypothetical protein